MKAKTKRRIRHVLTKKKLLKKKTSHSLIRVVGILVATVCTGSLAYAIAVSKPTINVAVRSSGSDGRLISAPATPTPAGQARAASSSNGVNQSGRASWYALGLPAPDALTCASRTFARGSHLLVKDLYNGNTVVCLVNDYGPESWTGRAIDLSRGSFNAVDNLGRGTIPVEITLVSGDSTKEFNIQSDISAVIGYSLCHKRYSSEYCDAHRQD